MQLHIEWRAPSPAVGTSQGRGNSGIFFMGLYELQIYDSYSSKIYADGSAAAIYGPRPGGRGSRTSSGSMAATTWCGAT